MERLNEIVAVAIATATLPFKNNVSIDCRLKQIGPNFPLIAGPACCGALHNEFVLNVSMCVVGLATG